MTYHGAVSRAVRALTLMSVTGLMVAGCSSQDPFRDVPVDMVPGVSASTTSSEDTSESISDDTTRNGYTVVGSRQKDPAFTQGLEYHDGTLIESSGLYGKSFIRTLDAETLTPKETTQLDPKVFAEGLTVIDDTVAHLTWRERTGSLLKVDTLEHSGDFSYNGEGWGLCHDENNKVVWRSDGSAMLYAHNPKTWEVEKTLNVVSDGKPLERINELECVGDDIYANVFTTNLIVKIDSSTGEVIRIYDMSPLVEQIDMQKITLKSGVDPTEAVLNGIAYDSHRQRFTVTGKYWDKVFDVQLHD